MKLDPVVLETNLSLKRESWSWNINFFPFEATEVVGVDVLADSFTKILLIILEFKDNDYIGSFINLQYGLWEILKVFGSGFWVIVSISLDKAIRFLCNSLACWWTWANSDSMFKVSADWPRPNCKSLLADV